MNPTLLPVGVTSLVAGEVRAVETSTEDPRARGAIERFTDRLMESPAPGLTRAAAREFAVTVAKRNDDLRPRHKLGTDGRVAKSEARRIVRDQMELAALRSPRVQASIARVTARVRECYPELPRDQARAYATARLLEALFDAPPMMDLFLRLYEGVMRARPLKSDAVGTVADALDPSALDAALAASTGGPESKSVPLVVDVPTILEINAGEASAP